MKFHGNIELQENEMQGMVLQLEGNFPAVPLAGRMVFRDKRLYLCAEVAAGIPAWIPLTNEIDTHIHTQDVAATTWTITHNLGTTTPLVQIFDAATNAMIIPDEITITSNNVVTVTLSTAVTGRAVVMHGSITGSTKPVYAYTYTQESLASVWVVDHNLGYYPIVRVFIGNEEILPASIVHNTINQTTITFSSDQIGVAKFV